jgi:Methyltransferase domain
MGDQVDKAFEYDGINFELNPISAHARPGGDAVVVQKPRWMIDRYSELQDEFTGANVVELGLFDGGSTVLLSAMFSPRKLLAVELSTQPLHQLDDHIASRRLEDRITQVLGVDQSDEDAVARLVRDCFGDDAIDLVIDDASHLYGPTCASFDLLFPLLRPGGLFIIEDWSHEHELEQGLLHLIEEGKLTVAQLESLGTVTDAPIPLGQLALELVAIAASGSGIVRDLRVQRGWLEIRRGDADLRAGTFDRRQAIGPMAMSLLTR